MLTYPGHGSTPFTASEVFWLNFPSIIFSIMSFCGSSFIVGSYIYMDRLKTMVNRLVAWLSFTDLCLCITMSISIITATANGQVAYIYAEDWFPIIQITNFFITASWLWSAAIAFASLNIGNFTFSHETEQKVMKHFHSFVWITSFAVTAVLTVCIQKGKAIWSLRFQVIFGLCVYVWNLFLFFFVLSRIYIRKREFAFLEEQKKMRQMMISLVLYLVPFIICWSVFIVCGMITFTGSFNSHYAQQFGFWTLLFMICLPPLQGACNAATFGFVTFEGPRTLWRRLTGKKTDNVDSGNSDEALPICYDSDNDTSIKSWKSVRSMGQIAAPKPLPIQAPSPVQPKPTPMPYKSSVYLIYFNSFMYYFSLGMKLMVKWTYVEALNGTLFEFGCTMAAFGLGWAVSAIPSAVWARRYNTKQVLLATTFSSLVGSILWAFASNPTMLIFSRFMSGLAAGNITVGRSFLAAVSTPENRTVIMANSSAASMLGSVLGPALSLILSYTPSKVYHWGHLPLHFNQYTYPGWVIIFICLIYMALLLSFKEPSSNASAPIQPPKLTAPIIICGLLVCITLCMLSFFETISLPIMIVMFRWTVPQACAVWIAIGSGSFFVQLGGIRIMNQTLKIEDRFGIYVGLCIGLFGSLILTGFTWQTNISAMIIGSIAIVSISGAFLFTFSLALIAKFLGRATIYYLGHIFAAGAIGRIVGPLWAVAASTKFSAVGLSLDGIAANQLNSLIPFAGCSVILLVALIFVNVYYSRLVPSY